MGRGVRESRRTEAGHAGRCAHDGVLLLLPPSLSLGPWVGFGAGVAFVGGMAFQEECVGGGLLHLPRSWTPAVQCRAPEGLGHHQPVSVWWLVFHRQSDRVPFGGHVVLLSPKNPPRRPGGPSQPGQEKQARLECVTGKWEVGCHSLAREKRWSSWMAFVTGISQEKDASKS